MPRYGRKGVGMGTYMPSPEEQKAMVWCIDNFIRMWPKPVQKGPNPATWWVEIQLGKDEAAHRSPEFYGPNEIWEQIYNWYLYYYKKHNDVKD